jgi:hypothetical protein
MVTVTDCGEPVRDVCVLPAVSATLNDVARVSVEVTAPLPAVAVDVALTVHTVDDVCTTDEIKEIPVRSKSIPAVVETVAQSIASLPVIVKLIAATAEVNAEAASVRVGAVWSTVDEFVTLVAASETASLPAESCTAFASSPAVGSVYATVTT